MALGGFRVGEVVCTMVGCVPYVGDLLNFCRCIRPTTHVAGIVIDLEQQEKANKVPRCRWGVLAPMIGHQVVPGLRVHTYPAIVRGFTVADTYPSPKASEA